MKNENMNKTELKALLENLIERWEHEIVEFKHASRNYSTDRIGKYFSALANEANLRNADRAWLVFGVANDTRRVLGSDFRRSANALNELKNGSLQKLMQNKNSCLQNKLQNKQK